MKTAMSEVEKASLDDYLELTKPRVVALMILTSVIGMFLSVPGMVPFNALILGNIGIALCAGSAAVINHVVDRKIDLKMARTLNRPVAKGRVQPRQALFFSAILGSAGMAILLIFINALTAWLTLASLFGYAVVYGSCSHPTARVLVLDFGAVPPLLRTIGSCNRDPNALLLVLIIFAWTPPHFWALAVHRKDEYAKAEIPMLPVTHGEKYTKQSILLYTVIMLLVTLLPFATGMSGWLYLLGALALGAGFLYWAITMMIGKKPDAGMDTFRYSIVYLMALFIIMLIDHYFI